MLARVYGLHNPCVRPMLSRAIVALSAAFAAQIRTIIRRRQKSEAKVECNRFATPLKRCCRPPPSPPRSVSFHGKDQDEGEQREEGRTLTLASARTLFLDDQKKIAKRIISIFLRRCKMSKNWADISYSTSNKC